MFEPDDLGLAGPTLGSVPTKRETKRKPKSTSVLQGQMGAILPEYGEVGDSAYREQEAILARYADGDPKVRKHHVPEAKRVLRGLCYRVHCPNRRMLGRKRCKWHNDKNSNVTDIKVKTQNVAASIRAAGPLHWHLGALVDQVESSGRTLLAMLDADEVDGGACEVLDAVVEALDIVVSVEQAKPVPPDVRLYLVEFDDRLDDVWDGGITFVKADVKSSRERGPRRANR